MSYKSNGETDVCREIKQALAKQGIWTLRSPRGSRKSKGPPAGTPDLVGYFPRWHPRAFQLFTVETKASHKDECRCVSCEAQAQFRKDHAEVVNVRARSLADALAGLGLS